MEMAIVAAAGGTELVTFKYPAGMRIEKKKPRIAAARKRGSKLEEKKIMSWATPEQVRITGREKRFSLPSTVPPSIPEIMPAADCIDRIQPEMAEVPRDRASINKAILV